MSNDNINGKVYKIENELNGKVYIGLTTRTVDERFGEHQKAKTAIGNAIRKHGTQHFRLETIDRSRSLKELFELEKKWIAYHDSFRGGYNSTNGGEGSNQKKLLKVYLTNEQGSFIEYVERNKKDMKGMELVLFALTDMFLQADSEEDKRQVVKTMAKLKPRYMNSIIKFGVIDKEDFLEYST